MCQNILPSVKNVLSSLQVERRRALYYFSTLLFFCKHAHTQALRVPLSPFAISEPTQAGVAFIRADLQYFCWMTQRHQQINCDTRIYQISPRIWHLWVLFFFPILHEICCSFQCPCVTPDACQKKFDFITELLVDFKKSRSENLNPFCGAGQFFALREAAGEMCIPTCPWLACCLRQHTYVCLHSWHHHAYKLANINWTKLQLEQV